MKVVLCLGWYFPDSIGGSEVYVHDLAAELKRLGVDVAIMAPKDGERGEGYDYDGVPVIRYPVPFARDRAQLEGKAPPTAFETFVRELGGLHADVFHLHSSSHGASFHHLRCAEELGLRTFTTVHVPGVVCERGTMMRYGREACDGRIDPRQCVPCWLMTRGMTLGLSRLAATAIAHVPEPLASRSPGRLRTLLDTERRIERSRARLHEVARCSLRVVAVCQWLFDALLTNGIAREKLVLCRQGVVAIDAARDRVSLAPPGPDTPLVIGYFGRATPVKGVDVLVRALRSLDARVPVTLRIHAIANSSEDRAYLAALRALAGSEPRISFREPLAASAVRAAMRECHAVAVPSRWLETGPLTVLEALSVGVPVLGSDLGGIAELVEPGESGFLLPCDDVPRWAAQIAALARADAALPRGRPRAKLSTTREVAEQMLALYASAV